jgi:hypothetical protein
MTRYRKEFMRIAKKLTLADIQCGADDDDLTLGNLVQNGRVSPKSNFLLGVFSKQGLMKVFKAFGFLKILGEMGLKDIQLKIDTSDPHMHRLFVFCKTHHPDTTICELILKEGPVHFEDGLLSTFPSGEHNFLQIEWLLLQNPQIEFDAKKPPLPGQTYPGLGVGDRVMEALKIMARRMRLEGITNKPRYFHTAFMFTKEFYFVNPQKQAVVFSISRDLLTEYSFYTVAWAAYFNCIIDIKKQCDLDWDSDYLILPLSRKYIKYFRAKPYQRTVQYFTDQHSFQIDTEHLIEQMQKSNLQIYPDLLD